MIKNNKLLMYIRKNNDPSLEPCGNPATIAAHEEYCPFRTTLCFFWQKKSFIVFNNLPDMLFSLSSWKKLLYKTWSKAFNMTKNRLKFHSPRQKIYQSSVQ